MFIVLLTLLSRVYFLSIKSNTYYEELSKRNYIKKNNPSPTTIRQKSNTVPPISVKNKLININDANRKVVSDENFVADHPDKIQSGMLVQHQRFGNVKVLTIDGQEPNRKATVFFQDIKETKQLLLKFAKLKIMNPS